MAIPLGVVIHNNMASGRVRRRRVMVSMGRCQFVIRCTAHDVPHDHFNAFRTRFAQNVNVAHL